MQERRQKFLEARKQRLLKKWFSAWVTCSPDTCGGVWRQFCLSQLEKGVLSSSSGWRPEMLLNIPQYIGQSLSTKMVWAKLSRVPMEAEKLQETHLVAQKRLNAKAGARGQGSKRQIQLKPNNSKKVRN